MFTQKNRSYRQAGRWLPLVTAISCLLVLAGPPKNAQAQINLVSSTFFGGSGDQSGTDIEIVGNELFASGRDGSSGILIKYDLPTMAASPPLSYASVPGTTWVNALTISGATVYGVGRALPPALGATDGVGGTEPKASLALFDTGGFFQGGRAENFFTYRGGALYYDAATVSEGSGVAVYVAGFAEETGFGGGRTVVAKYTDTGTLLWKRKYATDPNGNQIAGTTIRNTSSTRSVAWLNGYLYLAGRDRDAQYVGGPSAQGMLLKYDAAAQPPDPNPTATGSSIMTPIWARTTGFTGLFNEVKAIDGSLYAVGFTSPGGEEDFLIQKYDESGNLIWSTISGGVGKERLRSLVELDDRLFAVGYTFVDTAGGQDAVLMEIDPGTGSVLSTDLFGGTDDDIAHSIITDGVDLYVVGESRSFAAAGNAFGQNDLMLLRYSLNTSPTAVAGADQSIRAGDIVFLDGGMSFDDNTSAEFLEYDWSFVSKPATSSANMVDTDTMMPSFQADVPGTYVIQLEVTDEAGAVSDPDYVEVSSENLAPTALATVDSNLIVIGHAVHFDGSGSTDPEGDLLVYAWTISMAPAISQAVLIGAGTATPSLTPDVEGDYEVTLTVSDFLGAGQPAVVGITATTAKELAEMLIVDACDQINTLTPQQVTSPGNQNALCGFLTIAVGKLQQGKLDTAINKINQAIDRTDGCTLRGVPDGNGPGRDWVLDCDAQVAIYGLLTLAVDALEE